MVRKQIYLDRDADARLKREAKRRGISQAALIRERLSDAPESATPGIANPRARAEFLSYLRWVRETAESGPGTGWKFSREETYAERNERARADRHERPDRRRRPARAG